METFQEKLKKAKDINKRIDRIKSFMDWRADREKSIVKILIAELKKRICKK